MPQVGNGSVWAVRDIYDSGSLLGMVMRDAKCWFLYALVEDGYSHLLLFVEYL
jgi:hypothetical protein